MEEKNNTVPAKIEPVPVNSPLLADEVIVRDYTSGVDSQLGSQPPPPDPGSPIDPGQGGPGDPPPASTPPPSGGEYDLDPDAKRMEDPTREFTFSEDLSSGPGASPPGDKSPVDAKLDDGPTGDGFVLPEASAKAFSEMAGNALGIYVPKFSYESVKIDMNNVRMHVNEGNLSPEFAGIFDQANTNTLEALKFDPEEIKMFKKTLKDYLEYKNVGFANPETAFWAMLAILGTKQFYMINSLKKENRKLVLDALKITNPGMFKDYREEKKARANVDDKRVDEQEPKKTL